LSRLAHLLPLIDRLAGHRVMVVGDVLLDEYLIGSANRLSREAPIPVLEYERSEMIPGGACNPAANVAALGSAAIMVGVVGEDANARAMRDLLAQKGIDTSGLVADPSRQTTTKTRIMAQMGLRFPQQLARIDRIDRRPVDAQTGDGVIARIHALAPRVDAIMASDYLVGLLSESVINAVRSTQVLLTADAQGLLGSYTEFDVVKCNADEAARYLRKDSELRTDDEFAQAGTQLARTLNLRGAMIITRGPDGITLARADSGPDAAQHIPAPHIEDVYDTVGAGDTVLAVITLALLAGASYADAAVLANLAAGIVVRKVGNYAPSLAELRAAIDEQG
jgi:rfaE bifunctional protein kinase chain/domain